MSRSALVYDEAGNVVATLYCSTDSEMDIQQGPRVDVPHDHEALNAPKDWRVEILDGRAQLARRP